MDANTYQKLIQATVPPHVQTWVFPEARGVSYPLSRAVPVVGGYDRI